MSLIAMMCVGAMGMGFYRGWSDSPAAVSDSTAQVPRCPAAAMGSLASGHIAHLLKPLFDCQKWRAWFLRRPRIERMAGHALAPLACTAQANSCDTSALSCTWHAAHRRSKLV